MKSITLTDTEDPTQSAVDFEVALREVLEHYLKDGIMVSNTIGVLALVQAQITTSFNVAMGTFGKQILELIGELNNGHE